MIRALAVSCIVAASFCMSSFALEGEDISSSSTKVIPPLEVLEAKEFRLIGGDGRVTAQLTSSAEGTPSLFFFDKVGKVRLNLGLYSDGTPGVILLSDTQKSIGVLRMNPDGTKPIFVYKTESGQPVEVPLEEFVLRSELPKQELTTKAPTLSYAEFTVFFVVGLLGGLLGGLLTRRFSGSRSSATLIERREDASGHSIEPHTL